MNFSIYDLNDDIRKLLNLENFLEGMSVNDFVEELSKDHILKGAEVKNLEYLDPKPYIRTFEATLKELKQLGQLAAKRKVEAEREVEQYEVKHSRHVLELSQEINELTSQFKNLDGKISHVSEQVDPLGQALDKITNSRDRSRETIFLIRAYHGFFTKEKYEPLDNLINSKSYEDRLKGAKIVSNLLVLTKKIETPDLPKTTNCVKLLDKYSETMEQNLLTRFETALEEPDFETMRDIVNILFEFNGGTSVVQTFVNKNDLLDDHMMTDHNTTSNNNDNNNIFDDELFWIKLGDPHFQGEIKEQSTIMLLDKLKVAIKGHARMVQQVFTNPIPVMKKIIQRVYALMIKNKVEELLQFSLDTSLLAHLRLLNVLYVLVGDFSKDVKDFLVTNEFESTDNELNLIIDQAFYDVFMDYLSDSAYFPREKKHLENLIYEIVQDYTLNHETSLTNRLLSIKLENMDNLEYEDGDNNGNGTTKGMNERFSFHFSERKRLNQLKTFMKSHLNDIKNRIPTSASSSGTTATTTTSGTINGNTTTTSSENNMHNTNTMDESRPIIDRSISRRGQHHPKVKNELELHLIERVLTGCFEALSRILELEPNRSPEYALEILELLLFDFGKLYVESTMEVSYDSLKLQFPKASTLTEIDFSYLEIIPQVSDALYLESSCIRKLFLPCAINSPNIKNRMVNSTNNYIQRCEISINIILADTIVLCCQRLTFLLTKQKKKDFVSDVLGEEDDTECCELISQFLTTMYESMNLSLDDISLTNTLVKVGMSLLNQLLEHYKKFPVNSTGGIILTKDVIKYQSIIDHWNIPELSESFQLLREIVNLFTVHPNLINSLIAEGQLVNLKPFTLRQYIIKRTDFNTSYLDKVFNFK